MEKFLCNCKDFFPVLQEIVEDSWEKTKMDNMVHPLARDKTWRAKTMNLHIRVGLYRRCLSNLRESKGKFFLDISGYRLSFNKLGKNLCPSKAKTGQSRQLQGFCQGNLFSSIENYQEIHHVYLGYTLDSTEENLTGIYFVSFSSGKPEWVYPLKQTAQITPTVGLSDKPLVRIKSDSKLRRKSVS